MPAPPGLTADLAAYLETLESRLAALEVPAGFAPAFVTTSDRLTAAASAEAGGRWGLAADLKTAVWSDGAHWYRTDTGAQIV